MMKKILSFFAAGILAASSLSMSTFGASFGGADAEGLQIVTTIFPEYEWVKSVLGDNPAGVEVTLLLDSGVDLHSYQPSAEDILKISTCDLFIYVGGESDSWVDDALQESVNEDMIVINLMDVLGDTVREEESVEGMQEDEHHHHDGDEDHEHEEDTDHEHEDDGEHEEDADHDHEEDTEHEHEEDADHEHEDGEEHDHDHGEEVEYDEHVWLSLRNAQVLVNAIADAIASIDEDNAAVYTENAAAYTAQLDELDQQYTEAVDAASIKTLLFADRFPFRYLVDDYGLDYYAAFAGCSAETEASFETIAFLSGKVDELGLPAVIAIEGTDHRIAETIAQNSSQEDLKILVMDSMQSSTTKDDENGTTYLSIMQDNLEVLKEALG